MSAVKDEVCRLLTHVMAAEEVNSWLEELSNGRFEFNQVIDPGLV